MKSKIYLLLLVIGLLTPGYDLRAEELDQVPSWIDISYANNYDQAVSEYQVVTITVTNKSLWWTNHDYQVMIDYDPNQLYLTNAVYIDSERTVSEVIDGTVNTDDSNFAVEYQFYLQPDVDVTQLPVTITKVTDSSDSQTATVMLDAESQTTKQNIQFGDLVLNYAVDNYSNDGTNIEYNAHFEVLSNPNKEDFTLSLKKNNMSVSSSDIYDVKVRFTDGSAVAIDKNNFKLSMKEGQSFDLNITTTIDGLSSKDDKFEFFIYLQDSNDNFIRLSPIYFPNQATSIGVNNRTHRYLLINIGLFVIMCGLVVVFVGSNLYRKKKQTKK